MRNHDLTYGVDSTCGRMLSPARPFDGGSSIEISNQGKWTRVPGLPIDGRTVIVTGRVIRVARIHDEEWLDTQGFNLESCLQKLCDPSIHTRPDLFTFQEELRSIPRRDFAMEWESLAVAQVSSLKNWWEGLPRETRKNVRKSAKCGVQLRCENFSDELVRGILSIQNECRVRQGQYYRHYGKSFEQVKRDHSGLADSSTFVCAYFEDELIGFLKVVWRSNVAAIMQLTTKAAHFDKKPANALLAETVKICEARGVSDLLYGKLNYGNKNQSGLREFKLRNGFEELLVPRYYIPLTSWGKICVQGRLYRGIHQILPSSLLRVAIGIRAQWCKLTNAIRERELVKRADRVGHSSWEQRASE